MMQPDVWEKFLLRVGVPGSFVLGILITLLSLYFWKNIKLFIGDILGHWPLSLIKFARKTSIRCNIEGRIHCFVHEFNSEMYEQLLPLCKLEWVTEKSDSSYFHEGKAIVRVSFDRRNRDLNLYNVAYSYVRVGLLSKTKPFLKKTLGIALDLILTRRLLIQKERGLLSVFNNRFRNVDNDSKNIFFRLEETENRGFFKRILLQELHYFGESVGERAPNSDIEENADKFINWIYEIAIRERDERKDLSFVSPYFKVGLILVASSKTYSIYGKDAYILRAQKYASNDFPMIYLLARGANRGKIAESVAKELVKTECFSYLSKRNSINRNLDGVELIITCIPLKVESLTLLQKAWEKLSLAYNDSKPVAALVDVVWPHKVIVDVGGLQVELSSDKLSSVAIPDATRYFSSGDDLVLHILECQPANNMVVLSNVGTESDPAKIITAASESLNLELPATITSILRSHDYEYGMFLKFASLDFDGFVPRLFATFSRFLPLSEKYSVGQELMAIPMSFERSRGNFKTRIVGVSDPWDNIGSYRVGQEVSCIVREKREYVVTVEIEEGMEAILSANEISWDTVGSPADLVNTLNVGAKIQVKIISIKREAHYILVSVKRLSTSPENMFVNDHLNEIVPAIVKAIYPAHLEVTFSGSNGLDGFLHISEISWAYCHSIYGLMSVGESFDVKVLEYNSHYNSVKVSKKRCIPNSYALAKEELAVGCFVNACITGNVSDCFSAEVKLSDGNFVQAILHKYELSNHLFISENRWRDFLDEGVYFHCTVKQFLDPQEVVVLSRKSYLLDHAEIMEYGEVYEVKIVDIHKGIVSAYSDDLEGKFLQRKLKVDIGSRKQVILAKFDIKSGYAELELSSS